MSIIAGKPAPSIEESPKLRGHSARPGDSYVPLGSGPWIPASETNEERHVEVDWSVQLRQAFGFTFVAAVLTTGGVFLLDGILIVPAALLFWMAFSQLLPAVAYLVQRSDGRGGRLFRKRADGRIPAVWLLGYLPFVISRYVNVVVVRLATREPAATDLGEGILVGGRIMPWDRRGMAERGVSAVLDVCAEIPRDPGTWADAPHYLAVPVLDASGPTAEQLSKGVGWALERLRSGDAVLVQCTLGHGRSATFRGRDANGHREQRVRWTMRCSRCGRDANTWD